MYHPGLSNFFVLTGQNFITSCLGEDGLSCRASRSRIPCLCVGIDLARSWTLLKPV